MYRRVQSWGRRGLVVAAIVAILLLLRIGPSLFRPTVPESLAEGSYSVERVSNDGTLILNNGARVGVLGVVVDSIDGKVSAFIEKLLTDQPDEAAEASGSPSQPAELSKKVRLEFDRERLDRDGRFLAYVWIGDKLLNEELLRAGLGRADLQSRYNQSKKTRFRRAEQEAKSASRGRWAGR